MSKHILILGAGYAGLTTAIKLQKKLKKSNEAHITLINRDAQHCLSTSLHKLAGGSVNQEYCEVDILRLLKDKSIHFLNFTIEAIDSKKQTVYFQNGKNLSYDYLVIALGSEPETFDIPGLKDNALTIRSIQSALKIRTHIEKMFLNFHNLPQSNHYLTFVIGGSGFTGIQFIGELVDHIPSLCDKYHVHPQSIQIFNIEAAPEILPGFRPELSQYVKEVLEAKGVVFKTNTAIKEYKWDKVFLSNEEKIKTGTLIWTGGVRGNPLLAKSGFETVRGRVLVDEFLRVPNHKNIYIIGDGSYFLSKNTNTPYPPTAQIAVQQAHACAHNIVSDIRNLKLNPFSPNIKGTLVSIGKNQAAGVVWGHPIKGSTAKFIKKLIDFYYLFLIGGLPLATRNFSIPKILNPSEH